MNESRRRMFRKREKTKQVSLPMFVFGLKTKSKDLGSKRKCRRCLETTSWGSFWQFWQLWHLWELNGEVFNHGSNGSGFKSLWNEWPDTVCSTDGQLSWLNGGAHEHGSQRPGFESNCSLFYFYAIICWAHLSAKVPIKKSVCKWVAVRPGGRK